MTGVGWVTTFLSVWPSEEPQAWVCLHSISLQSKLQALASATLGGPRPSWLRRPSPSTLAWLPRPAGLPHLLVEGPTRPWQSQTSPRARMGSWSAGPSAGVAAPGQGQRPENKGEQRPAQPPQLPLHLQIQGAPQRSVSSPATPALGGAGRGRKRGLRGHGPCHLLWGDLGLRLPSVKWVSGNCCEG